MEPKFPNTPVYSPDKTQYAVIAESHELILNENDFCGAASDNVVCIKDAATKKTITITGSCVSSIIRWDEPDKIVCWVNGQEVKLDIFTRDLGYFEIYIPRYL